MVKVREDMTGWKMCEHGVLDSRLIVIKQVEDYIAPNGVHKARWLCECSCQSHKQIIVTQSHLKNGNVLSCGCIHTERASICNSKNNIYDISGDYAIGYTTKGEEYWIDKEDLELCQQYCWYYTKNGYLQAWDKNNKKLIYLHRLIMGFPDITLYDVDHKTHPDRKEHKIDNRKQNLEIKTRSENNMNMCKPINNTSGHIGVTWNEHANKWMAQITVNYNPIYLGIYSTKEDAIKARERAEIQYFGEYRYSINN